MFVLRQGIICIDIQSNLWIQKCLSKKTAANVRQRNVGTFSKEEEIIQTINNRHVVKLIAVSDNPITIMMETCAFSFTSFNRDDTINSLDKFLSYYDQEDLHCFFPTNLHKISFDTTKAVQYIHSNSIVHQDFKPANILVSNMYYNNQLMHKRLRIFSKVNQ